MQAFVVPGLVTYFLDRTGFLDRTATSCFHRVVAHVRVMTDDEARARGLDLGYRSDYTRYRLSRTLGEIRFQLNYQLQCFRRLIGQ